MIPDWDSHIKGINLRMIHLFIGVKKKKNSQKSWKRARYFTSNSCFENNLTEQVYAGCAAHAPFLYCKGVSDSGDVSGCQKVLPHLESGEA